ncbi:MAG: hypothetical protein IT379_02790, partial [Deltaproteobacteria bacterium]|nr:hypothetical protein [Deltaproteobacteria bacterium]
DAECADGDGCTTDRCVGGGCAHETIRCPRPGRCVAESCDPAIGRCVWSPLPDGTPCDLGLCCGAVCIDPTVNERGCGGCGNICGSGTACIAGACRACMGSADCDDRLACTMDSCVSGSCVRIPVDGCAIDGTCFPEGAIDPTNPCRSCQPAMRADAWTSLPGGTSCDDGSVCTEDDRCSEGRCIGGPSVDCSDGDACTEDACSEAAGGCTHTVVRSHCVIDGACYGEGQSAPFDTCLVCAPSSDPRGWTRRSVCH